MEDLRERPKNNNLLKNIPLLFKKRGDHKHTEPVNLSGLVDEVITDYISQRPGIKATFEVENNIVVQGDQSLLKTFIEMLIQNVIFLNLSSQHHSIVFGRAQEEPGTYFIMNNELGANAAKVSFGSFNYLDKKDFGTELKDIQSIITGHSGKFWAIGKKDVGSIFYFSIGV